MTYEDKRHDLIKTIKVITIIVLAVAGLGVGVVAYVMAGKERQAQWRSQLKGFLTRLKEGFDHFGRK